VWGYQPHDWVSIAAWNLGMKDVALEHARKCVEMEPNDMRLRRNVELIEADLQPKQEAA
jgi:hypothetical protein